MMRRHGRIVAFAAGCLALIMILAVLEIAAGIVLRRPMEPYPAEKSPFGDPLLRYDPESLWRLNPNMSRGIYKTNSLGFRSEEIPKETEGKRFRILCLGSSSTWGDGVGAEETYAGVLKTLLTKRRPDVTFEVLNAGVPGYSTRQSLVIEKELLDRFSFDLVTIDSLVCDMELAEREDAEYLRSQARVRVNRLLAKSRLYRLMRGVLLKRDVERLPPLDRLVPRVSLEDYGRNLSAMAGLAKVHNTAAVMILPLPLSAKEIAGMSAPPGNQGNSRKREMHLIFPHNREVLMRMKEIEPRYEETMRRAALTSKVPIVDLPRLCLDNPKRENLYGDYCHPSASGHAFIAGALLRAVEPFVDGKYPR